MASKRETELFRQYEAEVLNVEHTKLPLWTENRAQAIHACLAQIDIGTVAATVVSPLFETRPIGFRTLLKRAEEGLSQALRWLSDDGSDIRIESSALPHQIPLAINFCKFASDYVDVADFHKMYCRGQIDIQVDERKRTVRFVWPSSTDLKRTIRGLEGLASEKMKLEQAIEGKSPDKIRSKMETGLRLAKPVVTNGRLHFEHISPATLQPFAEIADSLQITEYDFVPDDVDLAGFTAGDFRAYFRWFRTWAFALITAFHHHYPKARDDVQSFSLFPTQLMPQQEFRDAMASLTNLPTVTVNDITERLRYDCRTSWPCIYLQPVIISDNMVVWSPAVIQASSYLRNMLRLMARTPALRDRAATLIGERERAMLNGIGQRLSRRGKCAYKLQKEISDGTEKTDIDLLAYNSAFPDELLLIEGKTVLAVDEINEVDAATMAMKDGQKQLELAKLLLDRMSFEQKRSLYPFVNWEAVQDVYCVVITPNSEAHQGYDGSRIPAMSLSTIDCKMGDNHFASPRKFWERAKNKPWLTPLDKWVRKYHPIQIGNVTYEIPFGESLSVASGSAGATAKRASS